MSKSKDIWEHYWVAEQPIFKHYAQTKALIKHGGVIGNTAHQFLIYSINGEAHCYYTKESYRRVRIDGKKLLNFKAAARITKSIELDIKKFWKTEKQLRTLLIEKEDVHSHKFIGLFKNFDALVMKIFAYFRTTWEATSFCSEEELKKILKLNYADSWEDKVITLVTATEDDLLIKEKTSWLKVLKNPTKEKPATNKNVRLKPIYCARMPPMAAVAAAPAPTKVEYRLHSKLSCPLSKCMLQMPRNVGKASPLAMP